MHRRSTSYSTALGIILLAACTGETVRQAEPPASSGGATTVAAGSVAPDSSVRDTSRPDSNRITPAAPATSAPTTAGTAFDPAKLTAVLERSRTKHDTQSFLAAIRAGNRVEWPNGPEMLPGALLPAKRIVAFYGNPLSKRMGALGEFPVDEMLAKLDTEVKRWQEADPSTPVVPALHLVAVVAQGDKGRDGMYRLRMDSTLIEQVYGWAQRKNALLFLDIQVGHSTVQAELPRLLKFLERPNVHLGLDPEFSMHHEREGVLPSKKIGQMDAKEINYAIQTLADLAKAKNLPPKVLVVHRFTGKMVSNSADIRPDPRVQVVMDMDGWGPPWLKFDSYNAYEVRQPVQFTGFKLFFHNDTKKGDALLTPRELLQLKPKPAYIQYQ
jgi:hypothetical protein